MVAQTLSETEFRKWVNESFARLDSKVQTIFNEFQSIRTAMGLPPLPTPLLPVSTIVLPPTSTTTSAPTATTDQPFVAPKQSLLRASQPSPKTDPKPVSLAPKTAQKLAPKQPPSTPLVLVQKPMIVVCTLLGMTANSAPTWKTMTRVNGVIKKCEWRPPWRFDNTSPNANGRTEWQPPWHITEYFSESILEDKDSSSGGD